MRRSAPILIVAEHCEQEQILELLNLGAADFITQPLTATDLLARIKRLLEQTRKGEAFKRSLKVKLGLKQIIGDSPVFRKEIEKIPTVAQCDVTVLISGETGAGKELFARALHYLSPRAGRPFVPVNCGAIPTDLVENELFGHEQGAYTGASKSQPGMIREADGGTLFLDEIDCLPQNAQIKLLRFLQEREYRPLGSTKVQQADVRVLAATNVDPEAALREGKVRQDLYYRLNVIPFVLPPLRQRREDISILARHFLKKYAAEFNKPANDFSPEAMEKLILYEWPGNVRELENVMQRAIVLSQRTVIQPTDVALPEPAQPFPPESFKEAKAVVIKEFERSFISRALLACHGNISMAAQMAQKNRRTFWELIRKQHIDVAGFRS